MVEASNSPVSNVFDMNTRTTYITSDAPVETIQRAFGGGGGGPVEPSVPLKDYVDKGDEATLARAEKAVSELSAKIDALPGRILWIAAGTVVATVGLIVAILAFGSDRFDGGAAAVGSMADQVVTSREQDRAQSAAIDQVNQKLDTLIDQQKQDNMRSRR